MKCKNIRVSSGRDAICLALLVGVAWTTPLFANEVELDGLKQKIAAIKPTVQAAVDSDSQAEFDISESALEKKNADLRKMEERLLKNSALAALNKNESPKIIQAADSAEEDFEELEEIPPSTNKQVLANAPAKRLAQAESIEQRAKVGDVEALAALNAKAENLKQNQAGELDEADSQINAAMQQQLEKKTGEVTSLSRAKADSDKQVKEARSKVAELIKELEETRNRLMVAETQVDRLSRIVDEHNRAKVASLSEPSVRAVKAVSTVSALSRPAPRKEPESAGDMPVATIIVDKANLRAGPGAQHGVLMEVGKGTRLAVEERLKDWYRVTTPTGARAWISSEVIAFGPDYQSSPTSTVKIRGFDANLEDKAFDLIRTHPE